MVEPMQLFGLHRYFLHADRMRVHYDALIVRDGAASVDDDRWPEQFIYMSLWYGCLFVVVEGWGKLGLSDADVDLLLQSRCTGLLKEFRHGVFHYREYWDEKSLAASLTALAIVRPQAASRRRSARRAGHRRRVSLRIVGRAVCG